MKPSSPFDFYSAGRTVFGRGTRAQVAGLARPYGRRALVVMGRSACATASRPGARDATGGTSPAGRLRAPRGEGSVYDELASSLEAVGMTVVPLIVHGEPTTDVADEGARLALAAGCEVVIGLGGGSVIDAAKAIAGLMTNGGEALDYLEMVGRGREIRSPAGPLIAVPTTAGTGSEVTKNAVLTEPRARVKVSMRSPHLLPAAAVVDPDLTHALPPQLTASTGLDALTQLIEAYTTKRANPLTDRLAVEGIRRSSRSLLRAVTAGSDAQAREDLALASLFGGFALANAGLGAVHGIAAPLGGRHPVPHGIACAVLLPHVFAANLRALRAADPAGEALARMSRVGEILSRDYRDSQGAPLDDLPDDAADLAATVLSRIVSACRVPGLAAFGVTRADIPAIVEGAQRASSMKGNPIELSAKELGGTIAAAL